MDTQLEMTYEKKNKKIKYKKKVKKKCTTEQENTKRTTIKKIPHIKLITTN